MVDNPCSLTCRKPGGTCSVTLFNDGQFDFTYSIIDYDHTIFYIVIKIDGCVTMKFLTWISWIPGIYDFFSVLIRENILDPPRFRSQPQLSVRWIVFY